MTGFQRMRQPALAVMIVAFLASCAPQVRSHGYVPSDEELEAVVVGLDTRATVRTIVGDPGANGILDDSGWYYVQSTYAARGPAAPVETDRQVVAISFDESGVVSNVERFGLEDGQVIALSRRVTEANTQGIGFIRQAFGNLGRINPATFFDDDN